MPKITVIVPVYKVEPYLRRCADSILAQTFTDFELILVDDGSPDSCGEICEEYSAHDERVTVIHRPNGGLSAARNAGIDLAFACSGSEWLSFIDSDDWVQHRYLEALYNGAAETGLAVIIGGFEHTNGEDPAVDENDLKCEVCDTETFFVERNVNAIVAWGKLYKKDSYIDVRYPIGRIHEDEYTTYKVLFKYENIAFCGEPLYAYFWNDKGIMSSTNWLPNMDLVDALLERVYYFASRRNEAMLRFSTDIFCRRAFELIKSTGESVKDEEKRNQIIDSVYKKVRPVFLRFGRRYYPFRDEYIVYDLYSTIFPLYTKYKIYSAALKKKIQRLVKNDSCN